MDTVRSCVVGLVITVAASIGLLSATTTSASADTYTTHFCGTSFPRGPHCQVTYRRSVTNEVKSMLVTGAGPAAVAAYLCARAPWFVTATCAYVAGKIGQELRDAVNTSKNNPAKCIAIRVYAIAAIQNTARGVTAVDCSVYVCCPTDSGGGGGGGGGGSWRSEYDAWLSGAGGSWSRSYDLWRFEVASPKYWTGSPAAPPPRAG